MLRNGARSVTRSFLRPAPKATNAFVKLQLHSSARVGSLTSTPLALTLHKPSILALCRCSSTTSGSQFDKVDTKAESKIAKSALEAHPDEVSTGSSVRHVMHEEGVEEAETDTDMLAGVRSDLKTIKETFALNDVPREALYLGMAGLLPYVATSLSTVYLAWDINHAAVTGTGFLLSGPTAEALLHVIEPLQIGYGAVIISFLGAIHWGLEWAKYGGAQGYSRYSIGVIAPALAWPTTLLPVEYALIAQFLAFNYMYFADARATAKGWCPSWYSTYRFVLTFVVGASLVASLIGRGQISDKIGKLPGPADRLKALRDSQMENLEKEETERRAKMVADDEEGDED